MYLSWVGKRWEVILKPKQLCEPQKEVNSQENLLRGEIIALKCVHLSFSVRGSKFFFKNQSVTNICIICNFNMFSWHLAIITNDNSYNLLSTYNISEFHTDISLIFIGNELLEYIIKKRIEAQVK